MLPRLVPPNPISTVLTTHIHVSYSGRVKIFLTPSLELEFTCPLCVCGCVPANSLILSKDTKGLNPQDGGCLQDALLVWLRSSLARSSDKTRACYAVALTALLSLGASGSKHFVFINQGTWSFSCFICLSPPWRKKRLSKITGVISNLILGLLC